MWSMVYTFLYGLAQSAHIKKLASGHKTETSLLLILLQYPIGIKYRQEKRDRDQK